MARPNSLKPSALDQHSLVLTDTGKCVLEATASTNLHAKSGAFLSATPCSDFTTFYAGQPILISIPVNPISSQILVARINVSVFLPKI